MEFSEHIVKLRKAKAWTQAKAAQQITIQQSYLSKLENGHYQPSVEVAEKIAKAYDVKVGDLLPLSQEADKPQLAKFIVMALGVFTFVVGYFTLVFNSQYFTYRVESFSTQGELITSYHVTDEYLGKVYQSKSKHRVTYYMIDQRDIHRDENSWLMLFGAFLFFSPIPFVVNGVKSQLKPAK